LETIGDKAELVPENIKNDCAGKQMWNIATGKTTIFNPFVANTLLGGLGNLPQVQISKIIHVT
jgi:hypothetical protein